MYGLCLFIKNMDSKRVLCEILQDVGKYIEQGGFDRPSKKTEDVVLSEKSRCKCGLNVIQNIVGKAYGIKFPCRKL